MPRYRCKQCGFIGTYAWGEGLKKWIKAYCSKTDKTVHLMRIDKKAKKAKKVKRGGKIG